MRYIKGVCLNLTSKKKEAKEAMVEGVAVLSMEPQKQPLPVATILSQHQAAGV